MITKHQAGIIVGRDVRKKRGGPRTRKKALKRVSFLTPQDGFKVHRCGTPQVGFIIAEGTARKKRDSGSIVPLSDRRLRA